MGLAALVVAGCSEDRRRGGGGGGGDWGGGGGGGDVPPGCVGVDCDGHGRCATLGGNPVCLCDEGYHRVDMTGCAPDDPCIGVDCDGHGTCSVRGGSAYCDCEEGYRTAGPHCVSEADPCDGIDCSGHGVCVAWGDTVVCACAAGYTPSNRLALDCVPTESVCKGGPIDYDVDGDGVNETWFEPTEEECRMFELINHTRATHDPQGHPECHHALMYSAQWSAHGRNHGKKMYERGELYHDDFPNGQNVAYGCDAACEMNLYMNGPNEPHCPDMSHHCNIMNCSFTHVGVGYYAGTWNTQNFY